MISNVINQIAQVGKAVKNDVAAKWNLYNHRRYLKRMKWTEETYQRMTDPDVQLGADRLSVFYHGYSYWYVFERSDHYCYELLYDYGPGGYRYGFHDIIDWCNENAHDKFRTDFIRMYQQTGIGLDGSTHPEWFISELGGGDHFVVAFQNPKDFFMFGMRWL